MQGNPIPPETLSRSQLAATLGDSNRGGPMGARRTAMTKSILAEAKTRAAVAGADTGWRFVAHLDIYEVEYLCGGHVETLAAAYAKLAEGGAKPDRRAVADPRDMMALFTASYVAWGPAFGQPSSRAAAISGAPDSGLQVPCGSLDGDVSGWPSA